MSDSNETCFNCYFTLVFEEGMRGTRLYRGTSVDKILDMFYAQHIEHDGGVRHQYNLFQDGYGDVVNVVLAITPAMIPAYRQEREQQRILAQKQQQLDEEIADMIERLGKEEVLARLKGYE